MDAAPPPAPAAHVVFPRRSAKPGRFRGPLSELLRWGAMIYLKLGGWRMEGDWPRETAKMVLLAAPHTSNWDGLNMLAAAFFYRIKLKWMGKNSLTKGPLGGLIKALGCVPVDRSAANDVVRQMADAFAASRSMVLAIPPEGTRSRTEAWKTGFYYIAHTAGVPILMTVLDYGSRTIRVSGLLTPSGAYDADLELIRSHYVGAQGKHADKFSGGS